MHLFFFLQYKLLLYLSQQKQVAAAKIHVSFVFTVSGDMKGVWNVKTNRELEAFLTLRGDGNVTCWWEVCSRMEAFLDHF